MSVDTQTGQLMHTEDIDNQLKSTQPLFKVAQRAPCALKPAWMWISPETALTAEEIKTYMKMHLVSFEECDQVIRPMAESGQESVGSMGRRYPMAVLSQSAAVLRLFRQQFAQVTNPPIDPLREAIVMSLETCLGRELSVFAETAEHAERVILSSPCVDAR